MASSANMLRLEVCPHWLKSLCKDGSLLEAVNAVELLDRDRIPVSVNILLCLLRRCAERKDLSVAKRLQPIVNSKKSSPRTLLADHLIRLFTSCGSLVHANQVFCKVSKPSVLTWNAIILAHAKLGEGLKAIDLYYEMQAGGQKPDKYLFTCILKVCTFTRHLDHGRFVHHQMVSDPITSDLFVDNALVFMYVECGCTEEAQSVFDSLKKRNVATWSALITGYAQYGDGDSALALFQRMQGDRIWADEVVFLCVLKGCSLLMQGMFIHNQVVVYKLESSAIVASAIVNMYARCGNLLEAHRVLDSVHDRDAGVWNSLIAGYTELHQDACALELFQKMLVEGTAPTDVTLSCALKACGNAGLLEPGMIIHDMLLKRNPIQDVIVGNTLLDMYAQCGALEEACRTFDRLVVRSVVSWGTIICAFSDHGYGVAALEFFDKLQQSDVVPDIVIFLAAIKACGSIGDLSKGRQLHTHTARLGWSSDAVLGTTLVDVYLKCKSMVDAQSVFDGLASWNCASWSAMLTGYMQQHQWAMVLDLFGKLHEDELEVDRVIFLHVLEACSHLGAVGQSKLVHDKIIRHGLEADEVLGSDLVDTYCKCGYLQEGYRVFKRMPRKDVVSWGAMIAGLAHGGDWPLAKKCLAEMRQQGVKPNEEIYMCVLIACSHAGLLDEGQLYFSSMKEDCSNFSEIEQFSCMIDLLGRAGLLNKSEDLMQSMPRAPNEISWTSLLSS